MKTLVASLALIAVLIVILWFTVFSDETKDGITNNMENAFDDVSTKFNNAKDKAMEEIENIDLPKIKIE